VGQKSETVAEFARKDGCLGTGQRGNRKIFKPKENEIF